ncbi:shufflon system plasmid conjugative transfer pilus tip adhesin PilV [Escherichia coli]|nr:shufflon system plasmid conjugative transfer pilus tip adhesin PilV [Escherichia coli]
MSDGSWVRSVNNKASIPAVR